VAGRDRALAWGLGLPLAVALAVPVLGPWALLGLAAYPAQVLRLGLRDGADRAAFERAALLTLGKVAEAQGVIDYHLGALTGRRSRLIEYK
jgi:hypothetical protein